MKGRLLVIGALLSSSIQMAVAGALEASQGYVRAMPPGQPNTAAFLTLTNSSGKPITLVSVESKAAKKVEFHQHIMSDKMRPVDKIDIEAGKAFTFEPGDYHIMLMQLVQPLKEQEEVAVSFTDAKGKRYNISLPVKNTFKDQEQQAQSHQHHH